MEAFYEKELKELTLKIESDPNNGDLYYHRSHIYYIDDKYEQANMDFDKAITTASDEKTKAKMYANRSEWLLQKDLLEKATADCDMAIALDPDNFYIQCVHDRIKHAQPNGPDVETSLWNTLHKIFTKEEAEETMRMLDGLTQKERDLLILYFGWAGDKPMSFKKIGVKMGITPEQAKQIKNKAMKRLQENSAIQAIAEKQPPEE